VKTNPSVYIIVLHWKAYDASRACLQSLRKATYPNLKAVVVDNASGDGSLERLRAEFPEALFLQNDANFGFSRGCNTGLREAHRLGADYIVLLNNDMTVEPGFLEPAIAAFDRGRDIGAVTGKIMVTERPDTFWQAGGHIDPWRVQGVARGKDDQDRGQYDQIEETGWASGAMSVFPKSTIERVGFLPEEYFFGQEEWDYSTAILRAGLKILYVPAFKGYHRVGASYRAGHPVLNTYGGYLNKMIYAEKFMPWWKWKLWRLAFKLYLKVKWPKLAREGCRTEEDYQVSLRAAFLAYEDHSRVKRVGLAELQDAARRLGSTPTWGDSWQPR
jgi:GT2 family glycosyltransferase